MKYIFTLFAFIFLVNHYSYTQNCSANFGQYNDYQLGVSFYDLSVAESGDSVVSWQWSFGDGNYSLFQNPNHQYSNPGSYLVCLSIETANNCNSTHCDNIEVFNCDLIIDTNVNQISYYGKNDGSIYLQVSNGMPPYKYIWNTGDTLSNITNLIPGNYSVTITDYFGCKDSLDILISEPAYVKKITGMVYTNHPAGLPEGVALLINQRNYVPVKWTYINNGFYEFLNVDTGKYIISSLPYFDIDTIFYPHYIATYYGNNLFWQDADTISIYDSKPGLNIFLVANNTVQIGYGQISGNVIYYDSAYYENNIYGQQWFNFSNREQNKAQNIPVFLLNQNMKAIDYKITDSTGFYKFNYLSPGSYYIYPEKPGYVTQAYGFTIDSSCFYYENINMTIKQNKIVSGKIIENKKSERLKVYPTPAKNFIYVEYFCNKTKIIEYKIYDSKGVLIRKERLVSYSGKNIKIIDIKFLNKGVYYLQTNNISRKFVVL